MITLEGAHMKIVSKIVMCQIAERDIYLTDINGLSLYFARTITEARNYIKGYQKQKVKRRTRAYIVGFEDRVHSERALGNMP